jgi:molybdopterin biosynthesis enzyme
MRGDGNSSDLPVYKSDEMIHFDQKLTPGKIYDLPRYIVQYLAAKGYAKWKWFKNADGSQETRVSHYEPRFSLRTIYQD